MATVRTDDTPVTVACWYEYRTDGTVLLCMTETALRLDHIRQNPAVALTVLDDDWYKHVSLLGRVVEIREDVGLVDIDRLSMRYEGTPYPERDPCVTVVVEVERWYTNGSPATDARPAQA
jgi:hypothetical protein